MKDLSQFLAVAIRSPGPVLTVTKGGTAGTEVLRSVSIGIVLAVIALTGCASARQQQHQQDIKTCANLGLPHGSQDNFQCALRQKRQRDREQSIG